jgi:hypothetical protein
VGLKVKATGRSVVGCGSAAPDAANRAAINTQIALRRKYDLITESRSSLPSPLVTGLDVGQDVKLRCLIWTEGEGDGWKFRST